jgi:hypothetical protein
MDIEGAKAAQRGLRDRARLAAAAALGLAAACAGGAAEAAHSGGGAHYTTVVVGGYGAPFKPPGDLAWVPLDLIDTAPTAATGELKKGQVIARHQVRARDAVVLDAPVEVGVQRKLDAGTVMVKVVSDKGAVAWCDVGHPVGILARNRVQCLAESSGQGKFDRSMLGWTFMGFMGLEAATTLADGLALGAAAPNHHAKPEERPTAWVGYRYCDGDGVVGPPRFSFTVAEFGKPEGFTPFGACAFGVWPNVADRSVVDVDGLKLKVSTAPGATADAKPVISYQLQGRAAAGPIARLTGSGSLKADSAAALAAAGAGTAPPATPVNTEVAVVFAGRPTLHQGPLGVGQAVLTAPVKHATTGVLQNRITIKLMLFGSDTPLEVGQPMFGIPVLNSDKIIWCAPRKAAPAAARAPGASAWDTACLTPIAGTEAVAWRPHRNPALLPWDSLYGGTAGDASSAPSVERKPIDLPPMTMAFTVSGVKPDPTTPGAMIYSVDWMLDWGEGPQKVRTIRYRVTTAGLYYLFLGLRIKLNLGADPMQLVATVDPMQRGLVTD